MSSARPANDKAWDYLRVPPAFKQFIYMDSLGSNTYECVILDGFPSKVASNSDDPPNSFRTRDTFTPHPTIPDAWKHVGRLDDRLTLMNGEKVLPLPMEGRVREEGLVRECVVFGIGKVRPGLLVFRSESAKVLSDAELIERLWPAVQEANSRSDSHAQISRDMIVLLDRDYPQTDKGTAIRARVYEHFAAEIEAAYSASEGPLEGTIQLEVSGLERYLLEAFAAFDMHLPSIDTDFFSGGVDSLKATTIVGFLKKELDLGGKGGKMSPNVVFEHPNVARLARHLYCLRIGASTDQDQDSSELEAMRELVDKYSIFDARDLSHILPYPDSHSVVS
jgi:hypothetical protein